MIVPAGNQVPAMGSSMSLLPSSEVQEKPCLFGIDSSGARVELLEGDLVRVIDSQKGSSGAGQNAVPAAGGQRMRVVRIEAQQGLVVVNEVLEDTSNEGREQQLAPEQLQLLNEGITLARQQMRQLLASYLDHCTRESCSPHVGLVQGIEQSIRAAHMCPSQDNICLDLAARELRDAEVLLLNAALLREHAAGNILGVSRFSSSAKAGEFLQAAAQCDQSATTAAASTVATTLASASQTAALPLPSSRVSSSASAACSAVRVVDISQNRLSGEGATALCAMLARDMPLVEELYLDSNNISDGIQYMLPSTAGVEGTVSPASFPQLSVTTA